MTAHPNRSVAPNTNESEEEISWLRSIATPRPFVWLSIVKRRRAMYVLTALLLIVVFEGWPELMTLMHMGTGVSWKDVHVQQVPLYMGMLVVVAFVGTCYALYKQFDDSKWLARFGEIGEANLLSVQRGGRQLMVVYRFWDARGKEYEREAVITAEGKEVLPPLGSGDIVPVLYDRGRPSRNLLWPEIARYVIYKPRRTHAKQAPIGA